LRGQVYQSGSINLSVNKKKYQDAMKENLFATEQVYNLVKQGTPFREAFRKISKSFKENHHQI
jgi:argininosuccinate lyase